MALGLLLCNYRHDLNPFCSVFICLETLENSTKSKSPCMHAVENTNIHRMQFSRVQARVPVGYSSSKKGGTARPKTTSIDLKMFYGLPTVTRLSAAVSNVAVNPVITI